MKDQTPREVRQDERIFPGYLLEMAWPEASKDSRFTPIMHEALVFSHEHVQHAKEDEAFRKGVAFAIESVRRELAELDSDAEQEDIAIHKVTPNSTSGGCGV